jgi:hypothetical protein
LKKHDLTKFPKLWRQTLCCLKWYLISPFPSCTDSRWEPQRHEYIISLHFESFQWVKERCDFIQTFLTIQIWYYFSYLLPVTYLVMYASIICPYLYYKLNQTSELWILNSFNLFKFYTKTISLCYNWYFIWNDIID